MKFSSIYSYSLPLIGAAMMFSLPTLSTPDEEQAQPLQTQQQPMPNDAIMPSEQPTKLRGDYYSESPTEDSKEPKPFESVDEDRDDKLTYTEMQKADAVNDIQEFRSLDTDESGDLDRREFTSVNHNRTKRNSYK